VDGIHGYIYVIAPRNQVTPEEPSTPDSAKIFSAKLTDLVDCMCSTEAQTGRDVVTECVVCTVSEQK
jgi:hypothetical protein